MFFLLLFSCPIPNTYTTLLENGNSSKAQFKLKIFSFVNNSVVYLHCKIRICMETPGSTCRTVRVLLCAVSLSFAMRSFCGTEGVMFPNRVSNSSFIPWWEQGGVGKDHSHMEASPFLPVPHPCSENHGACTETGVRKLWDVRTEPFTSA